MGERDLTVDFANPGDDSKSLGRGLTAPKYEGSGPVNYDMEGDEYGEDFADGSEGRESPPKRPEMPILRF